MSKKKLRIKSKKKFKYEFLSKLHRASEATFEIMSGFGVLDYDMIPMFNEHIVFDNGYHISIQSGKHSYSTPKKNLPDIRDYSDFEVMCFDMCENSLVIKLKKWKNNWTCKYGTGCTIPDEFCNIEEGHFKSSECCILPYLPAKDVDLLYHYLKKQKRKFVITEKYKKQYEEQF